LNDQNLNTWFDIYKPRHISSIDNNYQKDSRLPMGADESKITRLRLIVMLKQGPRGTQEKKLQNSDSMQLEGGFGGTLNDIGCFSRF
jgi:hypothetical protein